MCKPTFKFWTAMWIEIVTYLTGNWHRKHSRCLGRATFHSGLDLETLWHLKLTKDSLACLVESKPVNLETSGRPMSCKNLMLYVPYLKNFLSKKSFWKLLHTSFVSMSLGVSKVNIAQCQCDQICRNFANYKYRVNFWGFI